MKAIIQRIFPSAFFVTVLLALINVRADGSSFKFLSIGDWGDDKNFVGSGLSNFFAEEAAGAPLAFILGDNFYERGVTSVDDPQWKSKYLDVFSAKSLEKIQFMVTAGNHDYYGNVTAQVQYSKKDPTKRWLFPSLYHARYFEQNGIKIYVVSLDTWRLNGGDSIVGFNPATGRKWMRSREALRDAVLQGSISAKLATLMESTLLVDEQAKPGVDEEQYEWITRALTTKEALESDWRIVIGHFPIYSASRLEHGDTPYLVSRLDGQLRKLKVDAYFSGHDHILQISARDKGLHYYGSGAGGKRHSFVNRLYRGLKGFNVGSFGFMKHKATKNTLETTFVVSEGDGLGDTKSFSFKYTQSKKVSEQEVETSAGTFTAFS